MKLGRSLAPWLLATWVMALVLLGSTSSHEGETAFVAEVSGFLEYSDLEGGCYLLRGDDGKTYMLTGRIMGAPIEEHITVRGRMYKVDLSTMGLCLIGTGMRQ
jgi:hypothetical protein